MLHLVLAFAISAHGFALTLAAGLAWTEGGGDVLYVESALLPGERGETITGHLGEVMLESVKTAKSVVWSMADRFGLANGRISQSIHVHVPAGAVPKDGPSAGVTIATALLSLYLGQAVCSDLAMTGEISLTGLVLPVGGLKEKLLAAKRAGIRRVTYSTSQLDTRRAYGQIRSAFARRLHASKI